MLCNRIHLHKFTQYNLNINNQIFKYYIYLIVKWLYIIVLPYFRPSWDKFFPSLWVPLASAHRSLESLHSIVQLCIIWKQIKFVFLDILSHGMLLFCHTDTTHAHSESPLATFYFTGAKRSQQIALSVRTSVIPVYRSSQQIFGDKH